jgi:hypothetical protein
MLGHNIILAEYNSRALLRRKELRPIIKLTAATYRDTVPYDSNMFKYRKEVT